MGPRSAPRGTGGRVEGPSGSIVLERGIGANVFDVDGNRYVDLAAGFGALLLGHGHPAVLRALDLASRRLLQALGDLYPSDAKIGLSERLARLYPEPGAQVILGQSGADAVTAALKTALLHTGRPGVVAFRGAYHGLSYAPLAACGLRASYREPFAAQLSPTVRFVDYPTDADTAERSLAAVAAELRSGTVGAVLIEPILGRGGSVVPPPGFLRELMALAREAGALFVADEIWTGLGRAGAPLRAVAEGVVPDLVCLGKGLGGGLPISACVGRGAVMQAWERDAEVVHTSTFSGAPLACTAALATLDVLTRERLAERAAALGARLRAALRAALPASLAVRGEGLMVGIDLAAGPGAAARLMGALLARGYVVSTGGGAREVLVLTPPLTIREDVLLAFVPELVAALGEV